jgi:GNAT superfamily N-acetyltransferase
MGLGERAQRGDGGMTMDEIVRMERCHVKAWPAFETRDIQGWHWRYSGGGSQRANSVSTVDFTGEDPGAAVEAAEGFYRARGAVARFQTFDWTRPLGLDDLLRARGYRETESTITMFKRIEPVGAPSDTERFDRAEPEWRAVYLGEITENRRAVNTHILENIPERRAFFGCRREGRLISTGLSVIGFGCAVVECVATRSDARRQGGADAVLRALEAWAGTEDADLLGLQVVATNAPAIALYERLGFVAGACNRFWVRDI